jgi:hypothetical protein
VRECRIDKPTDEVACWWEETKISTHLRHAAGVCVLTTGLLIGSAGGAIATAEPESTGSSSTQSQDQSPAADEPTQPVSTVGTESSPTSTTAHPSRPNLRTTLRAVIHRLQELGKPHQRPVIVKKTEPAIPEAQSDNTVVVDDPVPDLAPATTDPVASDNSDSNAAAPELNTTAPVTNTVASDSDVPPPPPPPVPDPAVAVSKVVEPVTYAIARVAGAALAVPGKVMALPTSETPVLDAITIVQDMLIAVNDAIVPLAQMPTDLYSMLVVAGMGVPAIYPAGGGPGSGLAAAVASPLVPPTVATAPQAQPVSPNANMPLLGIISAPLAVGGLTKASLSTDLSVSGTAPIATESARPADALSVLEHTVKAILAPASLTALAAIALPGIGGLLIICAAGARVGYRQAKAALAVRSTGIARFTRHGPLGVVRAGSLVALHMRPPRALRVVRPEPSRTARALEQVA